MSDCDLDQIALWSDNTALIIAVPGGARTADDFIAISLKLRGQFIYVFFAPYTESKNERKSVVGL